MTAWFRSDPFTTTATPTNGTAALTAFTTDNGAFDHPGLSLCGFPGNYGEQQSQGQES